MYISSQYGGFSYVKLICPSILYIRIREAFGSSLYSILHSNDLEKIKATLCDNLNDHQQQ